MELTGLKIFKYLPAARKAENSNCKKCGFPTCMAYALKLAKGETEAEKCPFFPEELKNLVEQSNKIAQKTIEIKELKIGGENVLFRHEKTFLNQTALCVLVNCEDKDFDKKNIDHDKLNEYIKRNTYKKGIRLIRRYYGIIGKK